MPPIKTSELEQEILNDREENRCIELQGIFFKFTTGNCYNITLF